MHFGISYQTEENKSQREKRTKAHYIRRNTEKNHIGLFFRKHTSKIQEVKYLKC